MNEDEIRRSLRLIPDVGKMPTDARAIWLRARLDELGEAGLAASVNRDLRALEICGVDALAFVVTWFSLQDLGTALVTAAIAHAGVIASRITQVAR